MTPEQYGRAMREMHPAPRLVESKLKANGVLTGSRVFGGAGVQSDTDIILPYEMEGVGESSFLWLSNNGGRYLPGYTDDDEFQSIYIKFNDGSLWNALCMYTDEAKQRWIRATRIMQNLIKIDPFIERKVKDKAHRVFLFEALREFQTLGEKPEWPKYVAPDNFSDPFDDPDEVPF